MRRRRRQHGHLGPEPRQLLGHALERPHHAVHLGAPGVGRDEDPDGVVSTVFTGADAERLAAMHSPAGIDIGAVTPEEIALSILTEIVELRRRGQRRSISILSSSKC